MPRKPISIIAALTLLCGAAAFCFAYYSPDTESSRAMFNTCMFLFGSGVTTLFVLLAR